MKVVVTSNGTELDSPSNDQFGRCPTFVFVDTESMAFEAKANEAANTPVGVGVAMPGPTIHQLKQWALAGNWTHGPIILDAPPGTACPVVETIRDTDFVLLVTEPTPFGLHDLKMAVEVARDELALPAGVVVNRDGIGDRGVDEYCESEGVPILRRIDHDRRIAEAYSEGIPLVEAFPDYKERFQELYRSIVSSNANLEHRESTYARIGK